jgi:hypothetical protein
MAGLFRRISGVNQSRAGKTIRSRPAYILVAGQNFRANGVFSGEGHADIYLASSNAIFQVIDCMDIFTLLSG